MTETLNDVADNLEAAGVETRTWETGAGRLLISAYGARILRCDVDGVEGNLFFHAPDLRHREKTARMIALRKPMIGGDRLWIAPENAYHFTNLEKAREDAFGNYKVPPASDPGDYQIAADEPGHFRLQADATLADYRNLRRIRLRITRQFDTIDRPAGLSNAVRCASFAVTNTLEAVGGDNGAVAGAWSILQVPPTGVLVCPTVAQVNGPRSYYEDFDEKHVTESGGAVRFRIDAAKQIKMGLSPTQTNGRMGYYRKAGGASTLIVRLFLPQPGLPYVDVPRSTDDIFGGDCLQAYNDNGGDASFGEMEYHDPAVVVGRTPAMRSGVSITHVLVGDDESIRQAGGMLLGVSI